MAEVEVQAGVEGQAKTSVRAEVEAEVEANILDFVVVA
jgi:hypothetical protein